MRKCSICGSEVSDGATVCPFCGSKLSEGKTYNSNKIEQIKAENRLKFHLRLRTLIWVTGVIGILFFIVAGFTTEAFHSTDVRWIGAISAIAGMVCLWKGWDLLLLPSGILAAIGAVRILLITLGRILTLYDMSSSVWNDVEAGDYVFVVIVGVISVILMAVMAFVQFMYYWTGRE